MRRSSAPLVLLSLLALLHAPVAHAARLVIVHANDTHGHALPYGDDDDLAGMARLATVVKQAKAADANTLFLNAGDTFEGTLFFNAGHGEFDFQLMEMMGCDAMAVGNHDFAIGTQNLFNALTASGATFPYFAANIDLNGVSQVLDPLVTGNYTGGVPDGQPYAVKTMPNGLKVGMFGMVTSETANLEPSTQVDGVSFFSMATSPSVIQIAQGIVDTLRNTENVDIVVMINHFGLNQGQGSASLEDDTKMAQGVTGIDVIVGGHDHVARPQVTMVNNTICVYAGAYTRFAGTLDLDVTGGVVTVNGYGLQELNRTVPQDAVIAAAIDGFKSQVEAQYPGAYSDVVVRNQSFMDGATDSESGVGNMITDSYRAATGTQIGIDFNGSIRFDGFRGPMYPADVFNILSLDYDVALGGVIPLTAIDVFGTVPNTAPLAGARNQPVLKAMLELLISDFLRGNVPSAGYAQMSGVEFEYDPIQPDFSRISNILIGGQPFNPTSTYTASTSENIAGFLPFVDTLFDLTAQPNSLETNSQPTSVEPWQALTALLDSIGRNTCPQNAAVGRARTVQEDLALMDDCGADVEPRSWQPGGSVTVTAEVINLGMTASTATTLEVYYEESPLDPVPNLILAGTATVPSVPAFSGTPGRATASMTFTVPATLPAGTYPVQLSILTSGNEQITDNNVVDIVMPPRGNIITGLGSGPAQGSEVRIFDADGAQACSFQAYGTGQLGVDVAAGDIDGVAPGRDEALTAPGPGPIFGPHIRAWSVSACPATPINKVNFYAYGTLRYGARINAGDVDGDGVDEIVTGAGRGAVFGPHFRGWNYDGTGITVIAKINFFAYGTLKYGVEPATGELDRDGYYELLTAPGPGSVFGHQVRGFNYDGTAVSSIGKVNFFASTSQYGGTIAASDIDGDGYDEIATGQGAGATNPSTVYLFDYDGAAVTTAGSLAPFTSLWGANVGPAERDGLPWGELLAAPGPDPAANADVKSNRAILRDTSTLPEVLSFTAYTATPYGANVHGGRFGY